MQMIRKWTIFFLEEEKKEKVYILSKFVYFDLASDLTVSIM
jgi:hypothetical protein